MKSQGYLVVVRLLPCIVPGCCPNEPGGEAHHVYTEGGAMKCSDLDTVPICTLHHTQGPQAVDGFNQQSDDEFWLNVVGMPKEHAIVKTRVDALNLIIRGKLLPEEKICQIKEKLGMV